MMPCNFNSGQTLLISLTSVSNVIKVFKQLKIEALFYTYCSPVKLRNLPMFCTEFKTVLLHCIEVIITTLRKDEGMGNHKNNKYRTTIGVSSN